MKNKTRDKIYFMQLVGHLLQIVSRAFNCTDLTTKIVRIVPELNGKSTFGQNISKKNSIQKNFELFSDIVNLYLPEIYCIRSVPCFIQMIFKSKVHVLFVFVKFSKENIIYLLNLNQ